MAALTEVVQAGKARHIGFSEWPVEKIEASLALEGRDERGCPASRSIRCCGARPRQR